MSQNLTKKNEKFDSGKVLIRLSDSLIDSWTVDDAMKGISIIGGTGSGKTSASGKAVAMTYLKEGWGGLVLCAKSDEANLWREYCEESDRSGDLIIFSNDSIHEDKSSDYFGEKIIFNPIDYEMKRSGKGAGETQNITNIFMNVYRMGNRIASEGDTKEERYWDTALKRCLNRVIELLKLSKEDLSYSNMVRIINSSNDIDKSLITHGIVNIERGEISAVDEGDNYCVYCLIKAYLIHFKDGIDNSHILEIKNAYDLVGDYFTKAMPTMGSRTKSVVTESFMGLAEPFLSGLLYRHFSGATNIFPEWTYEKQKIIILDFAIKDYLDAGITAQCVFKLMFQQAIERRNPKLHPTPVFLWCDEAQYFVNPYDQIFLTTARTSRTATVYLSQSISNYFAVMGSGSDAKARVDSLLGNLSTKIFHANTDAETNEYASRLIGNTISNLAGASNQRSFLNLNFSRTDSINSQYLPQVQPKEFTTLKTGGETNDYQVQAILLETGREWAHKKNYIRIKFTQNFTENE